MVSLYEEIRRRPSDRLRRNPSSSEERCGSCVSWIDRVEGYDIKESPMRTTFLYVLALAAAPFAILAGAEPDSVEVALRKLRQEFVSAVNAGDLERAMACWSTDVRIMVEGRPPIEGPAAQEATRRKITSTVRLAMETERIDYSGNLAYELGRITMMTRGPDGKVVENHGKYLDVWKKYDRSDWRIIAHAPSGNGDPH
jgi:ketosteroid isomerase-like protein